MDLSALQSVLRRCRVVQFMAYEPEDGESIETTAQTICFLSTVLSVDVNATFNGIPVSCRASVNPSPRSIVEEYELIAAMPRESRKALGIAGVR